ncbi:hypothetical protein AAFF_G00078990 [Aldrovandia affinis]|uniref:Uncharacterized protein n=1 Tax=Aldrovandia affinis TaxID=143900 RepID=A0AAD7RXB2_9TELE|nr:hypothetical protein AAFF_G00078990 [Aldrovandia affinis]
MAWLCGVWGRRCGFEGHVCTPLLLLSCLLWAGAQGVTGVSVAVVLFPTDAGERDGASAGVTPAPTSEHEDDNSLGYTGTAGSLFLSAGGFGQLKPGS